MKQSPRSRLVSEQGHGKADGTGQYSEAVSQISDKMADKKGLTFPRLIALKEVREHWGEAIGPLCYLMFIITTPVSEMFSS